MGSKQTDKGPLGKWSIVALTILAAGLIIASLWSVVRTIHRPYGGTADNSLPQPVAATSVMESASSQEEMEKRHIAEMGGEPAPQPVEKQPAVAAPDRKNEEVILREKKAKVNRRIVERLKQYAKDHPNLDNRELQEQIKKRESQIAPSP